MRCERARVARPQPFVGFDAEEHVELARAFFDGGRDRQPHRHQADAVLLIPLVERALVEVEAAAVGEAVGRRDDRRR